MKISVFLSYPKPHLRKQQSFINRVVDYLDTRGFAPRTLGVTDYDMDAPLKAIRRLMLESNGLITVAFRRALIISCKVRPDSELPEMEESTLENQWLTSPYAQIEPAMAYQLGLSTLVFREKGVLEEGILEKGVVGFYMPVFDLDAPLDKYFASTEWAEVIGKWEGYVRAVVDKKGNPPKLF